MKSKAIKIYSVGDFYETTYAIRCKDVKDIEEARNIILKFYGDWKDEYSDEEYQNKFGKPKVVILKEETCYIRHCGEWVSYGYECVEWDWKMSWKKTDKIGRGSMKCYVFYVEDSFSEYETYLEEKSEVKENE